MRQALPSRSPQPDRKLSSAHRQAYSEKLAFLSNYRTSSSKFEGVLRDGMHPRKHRSQKSCLAEGTSWTEGTRTVGARSCRNYVCSFSFCCNLTWKWVIKIDLFLLGHFLINLSKQWDSEHPRNYNDFSFSSQQQNYFWNDMGPGFHSRGVG